MPNPTTALTTHRPDLEASFMEFDLEMDQRGYIATRVLPVAEVASATGTFGKLTIEDLLKDRDTTRAPGAGYARGDYQFATGTYTCIEHGAEEPVDDREAAMYSDFFDAEQVATSRAMNAVLRNAEERAAALLFNTSTWTPTAVTTEWSNASAVPITDVETEVQGVYNASGLWPNALIITRKVFRNLRNVTQIIDRVKYQGFLDVRAENITAEALSQVFDLQVIVAGGTKDSAVEGQAASPAPIWDDEYAMIAKVATSNDFREACVGRTFHWNEDGSTPMGTVESYREEQIRANVIRVRHDVDEVVLYSEAAKLLSNITA